MILEEPPRAEPENLEPCNIFKDGSTCVRPLKATLIFAVSFFLTCLSISGIFIVQVRVQHVCPRPQARRSLFVFGDVFSLFDDERRGQSAG